MSKQITIKLPDRVVEALERAGVELERSASEELKAFVLRAYECPEGALMNLRPVAARLAPGEQELPFDGLARD